MKHSSNPLESFRMRVSDRFRFDSSNLETDGNGNLEVKERYIGEEAENRVETLYIVWPLATGSPQTLRVVVKFRGILSHEHIRKLLDVLSGANGPRCVPCLRAGNRFYPMFEMKSNMSEDELEMLVEKGVLFSLENPHDAWTGSISVMAKTLHLLNMVSGHDGKMELWKKIESCSNKWRRENRKMVESISRGRPRNHLLAELMKMFHDHTCQLCGTSIPSPTGVPYVEVHHIVPLSENGLDVPDNMLVVCPNCHKTLHLWNGNVLQSYGG